MAEDIGIEISGFAAGLYWKYPFTSSQKEVRERAKEILKRQIEIASLLEVDTILVVPGAVGVDFMPGAEVVEYDIAYERVLESLIQLENFCENPLQFIGEMKARLVGSLFKIFYTIRMMKENLIHARTCVYNCNYLIVFSTKYRKKVLDSKIEERVKEIVSDIAKEKGFTGIRNTLYFRYFN